MFYRNASNVFCKENTVNEALYMTRMTKVLAYSSEMTHDLRQNNLINLNLAH